jgi:hypothetical protein
VPLPLPEVSSLPSGSDFSLESTNKKLAGNPEVDIGGNSHGNGSDGSDARNIQDIVLLNSGSESESDSEETQLALTQSQRQRHQTEKEAVLADELIKTRKSQSETNLSFKSHITVVRSLKK